MRRLHLAAATAAALALVACEPTDDPAIDPGLQQEELTPEADTPGQL